MKRRNKDRIHQSLIMGLCSAGCFGIATELGGDKTEPYFWMVFVTSMLVAFIIVKTFRVEREPVPVYDDFGQNNKVIFLKRMNFIKKLADRHYESAKLHSGSLEYREFITIPTEDMLKIWDMSDQVIQETIVPSDRY